MKANLVSTAGCLVLLLWQHSGWAAVTKTQRPDAPSRDFVFIENNADDNYFVTPGGVLDPRITGSNRWTGLKYNGSGTIYQQSLGYIDNGYNTAAPSGRKLDMWLENSNISNPLTGLRCINWYSGCDMATSLILPQKTDAKGFYGVTVTPGGAKWLHGMMSDMFYQSLEQMPVGSSISFELNSCYTTVQYDATKGGRCVDQASGTWYARNLTHLKAAHLRLMNTNALTEVFINTDGIPTLGQGNSDCKMQTIGTRNGISCKMVNYSLQNNGLSNTSIRIFPTITNEALASSINNQDMQFSLDGSNWQRVSGTTYYYTFNQMKSANAIYIFFSSNLFKQMVAMGISDINTRDLFNFRFRNTTSPESGWYEFSTSNSLIIKPRDFGVSIVSDEFITNPTRTGNVGQNEPSLNFGYIVTTSGKTTADEVLVKVKGPSQIIDGQNYCIFSSSDKTTQVPFPARLTFTTINGSKQTYDTSCDDQWHDMTQALWSSTPWNDASGDIGTMEKTNLVFSILMNNARSSRTVNDNNWYGEVSASGEIHVKATWRNVN